jgi:hypothetical protein
MGFLKDANSLAYYNIKSGTPIHLHLKKRWEKILVLADSILFIMIK